MFIQIGDIYINQDHIESIEIIDNSVIIFSANLSEGEQPMYSFGGDKGQAILDWLEYKAEVSKVY